MIEVMGKSRLLLTSLLIKNLHMLPTNQTEDPFIRLLEKDLRDCINRFENSHGINVAYVKFELLRQETGEGVTQGVNFDARIDIIV